ncbi:MAG: DUF3575 domain-containing protein [Muribaculaceae bacterium]|nr:DUF3575 domain-containing protein [Muribaculaceae bacterium]
MNVLNRMNCHIRLLTVAILLTISALKLSAEEKGDSVLTFRFFSGRDMFYSPALNNEVELAKLFSCVDQYKEKINDHKLSLHVDGYSNSKASDKENLRIAKIRSNRVKSELITRKGLKEDNFVTHNHAEQGNFVTVRLFIPVEELLPSIEEPAETPVVPEAVDEVEEVIVAEEPASAQEPESADQSELTEPAPTSEVAENIVSEGNKIEHFALKTNLLYYAALMPNVQIEWMFTNRWSAALEFQGAWYAKEDPHKVYRVSTLMPEVRYWVIDRSRWHGMYVGLFIGGGLYDLCNGKTEGHKGEGGLAGISAGYMWPVSKHLSLEAGIGLGYMQLRDKVYTPLDGHFLYQYTKTINYFGPLRLNFSLVWRF